MMLLIAFSAAAQEEFFDDVYFSSKNKKKKEQVEEKKVVQPKQEYDTFRIFSIRTTLGRRLILIAILIDNGIILTIRLLHLD